MNTRDVCNSSKEPGGYLKKAIRNDRIQALRHMGLRVPGMIEHYQKRIEASRYVGGIPLFGIEGPFDMAHGHELVEWLGEIFGRSGCYIRSKASR